MGGADGASGELRTQRRWCIAIAIWTLLCMAKEVGTSGTEVGEWVALPIQGATVLACGWWAIFRTKEATDG